MSAVTVTVEEGQRQAIVLALARLSVTRPGWLSMLRDIAGLFHGDNMFCHFRVFAGPPPGFPTDTSNTFQVVRADFSTGGYAINIMDLDRALDRHTFTAEEALQLAAWLAVLADPELREFPRIVEDIKKPKGTTT